MACRLYLADNIVGRHLNWTDLRQHGSRARIRGQLADSSNVAAEHELGGGSKRRREARRRRRGGGHARRASFARRARMASRRPDRARASAERRARRARGGEAQREGSERRLLSPRPERRAVSRYSRTKFALLRAVPTGVCFFEKTGTGPIGTYLCVVTCTPPTAVAPSAAAFGDACACTACSVCSSCSESIWTHTGEYLVSSPRARRRGLFFERAPLPPQLL